ncbi:MAG: rRNA maturation RNase YbeY [Candidatus Eremiobacteraeota bacterium]|nr:rRNA maturation RNase YbeY [Candidatus Eremiobacteraeota bacterium]
MGGGRRRRPDGSRLCSQSSRQKDHCGVRAPSVKIYVRNTTRRERLNLRALKSEARKLLSSVVADPQTSLSLSLIGDAAMRRLNREYRGKDRPTDVLSFGVQQRGALQPRRGTGARERSLGDVVISVDTARRQALGYGASLDEELRRLLIHGLLHLMGHDHERPSQRARMRAEERRLAALIGLRWPY